MESLRAMIPVSPELTVFVTALCALLADLASLERPRVSAASRPGLATAVSLLGLAVALLLALHTIGQPSTEVFSRAMTIDPVSQFFKVILIFSGMITILQASMSREVDDAEKTEMYALILLGTLGLCVMVSAVHFLVLFLAYEMTGITLYVLAAFKKDSRISSEAGVKLFVHGALTTTLFAVGIVMLYGVGKSFNIIDIRTQLAANAVPVGYLWVVFGLIFVALAARLAVFPFHFLAPDVVEGSPSPVSSFFSVSSTIAAMAFGLRLCIHIFSVKGELKWTPLKDFEWPDLVTAVAAITMTVGNLTALYQTNLKRLIGYSCIAQIGYILMGVPVVNHSGISAVLFSLASYAVVTLGTFFVIQMVTDAAKSEKTAILRGLVWRNPYEGVALCVFLLSLAGLPPLVGFVGRVYILGIVVHERLYWLAIVAAINWVLGLAYCLSMIRQVFASEGRFEPTGAAGSGHAEAMVVSPISQVALTALLLPTMALGIYWDPLMNYITRALGAVSW